MVSRVAAVKVPRTHNRRRVTGSSGRRREGRESEPQRPNMSRRVFTSAVLLLLVLMCCGSGAASAKRIFVKGAESPQRVDIFVPEKTRVVTKSSNLASGSGVRGSFGSPSLVRAGGVIVAFAEGCTKYNDLHDKLNGLACSDIVAGYIKAAERWSSLVDETNKDKRDAYTVFSRGNEGRRLGVLLRPTAIARDNKVFLLVGSCHMSYDKNTKRWKLGGSHIQLVVGDVTQSNDDVQSEPIKWGAPKPVSPPNSPNYQSDLKDFLPGGGSGIVMLNGTLVFPLTASKKNYHRFSMMAYSTDSGKNWVFPQGMSSADCVNPRITEWEWGQILMVTDCKDGQMVYESRDMGTMWTEAIGTLPGAWVDSRSGGSWDRTLRVGSIITATIEGRRVMLYTQKRYLSREKKANALYLWVTDNSRTFHVGPLSLGNAVNGGFASTLLYADGALHFIQENFSEKSTAISLSRLTEELKTIRSVLSTWAKLDAFFFNSSTPTAGLVGLLSNAASDRKWIDEYRCVNATVMEAARVKSGYDFTGPGSGAIWPVNSWEYGKNHGFVDHNFALVATVTIRLVPYVSTPLLAVCLGDSKSTKIIGLSYSMNKTWETVFDRKKTTSNTTWELGKEHQVALMLQDGNKGSVYVDGQLVGSSENIPTPEMRGHEISHFYIGGDEEDMDRGSSVMVKNVFLYDRPLSVSELKMVRKINNSARGGASRLLLPLLLLLLMGLWGFVFIA
ncbi:putative trans-sialidase, Group II [Trypanosoma cruzi]|uniref:Trans-sialidase, putative n=2 Tax=Trypanosoma cruzi TaxID=5693 RepID=Q4DUG3_TRYCC|nr:trans-sialidase, putative [Trypanosoma cruzi]EAN96151.1 trans-sialidase, putative [Trypanosoma cruzi]PWV01731.1 putative trans-sialidase, Group II [Trypanosoma cruzi]|eukprot:XP_818002.1 trans-sialidase [Trypanosoma cruzi strain CL Brener]